MKPRFIHLHLHSEYSLKDGIVRIKPLIAHCQEQQIPAIALTDVNNLFAAVKFYKQTSQQGIKAIFGGELTLQWNRETPVFQSVFLCQNEQGYQNLTQLISKAYTQGQQTGNPIVQVSWLTEHAEGLIMLSGAEQGDIGQAMLADNTALVAEQLQHWQTLFADRYYIELCRTGHPDQELYIQQVLPWAEKYQIPVVATNNVRFIHEADFEAHEARVCIHDGYVLEDTNRPQKYTQEQYLRSEQDMLELFKDIPAAIDNTVEIAKRCNVSLQLGKVCLPAFPTPEQQSEDDYLRDLAKQGLEERLQNLFDVQQETFADIRKPYDERLQIELDVIINMGFPGYFLIVADFIQWARNNGVPVGPGRGSGAGSLVAYALQITDLDPLKYELLFERFLNPERVSMPDFDIDFCMAGRDRVIDYVAQTYGRDSVSQIITFGTMAAKAVVRDVGRVLGHPYGFVDKIAKLIPFEIGMTLDKALVQEEQLQARYQQEPEVQSLIDLAKKLEGIARNAGKHAGGVVIAPSKLTDFAALYCEPGSEQVVTQFDKDDVEAAGLVKFDFLGLRTLTIIDWAVKTINTQTKPDQPLDIAQISTEDKKSFTLLKACSTTGVFQLESRGMKDLIKRLQPDCFEDIIALVALFRPGPLQSGMVDDFIDRKHGRAAIEYPHPDLEPILKPTYGVILYQEQVMQIAQVLAGYTLGGADMLRRAMGKKKPEEMAKQREIFLQGCLENTIDKKLANSIFDLMEKFAGYGFNKSHSAAYAYVSLQTAWLKAHYPAEFMAAVLTSEMDHTDKIVIFIEECKAMKLPVIAPDINRSEYTFTVNKDQHIVYGLGAIKGVGENVIEAILQDRKTQGHYKSLFDFCQRLVGKKLNRRVLEALVCSGAMDALHDSRSELFASIEKAIKVAEKYAQDHASGQHDLFGGLCAENTHSAMTQQTHVYMDATPWTQQQILENEKQSLGLYFSGHPVDCVADEIKHFTSAPLGQLTLQDNKTITIAGLITQMRVMLTRRNDKMAFLTLSDSTGTVEVAVFSDVFEMARECLHKDAIVMMEVEIGYDTNQQTYKMNAKRVFNLNEARKNYAKCLQLKLFSSQVNDSLISKLQAALQTHAGGSCPLVFVYQSEVAKAKLHVEPTWWVELDESLLTDLQALLGLEAISVIY